MRRFLSRRPGKKPETVLQKNRRMLLKARKERLALFKSVKMSRTAKRIVKKAVKAVLATDLEFPTYAERRARMRTILKTCMVEAAKVSKISKKDRKTLLELSELFPQQINEKNQPKKILERFELTEKENRLVKSLSSESVIKVRNTLNDVADDLPWRDESALMPRGQTERYRLGYLLTRLEFYVAHDIRHAAVNFIEFTQAAR